MVASCTGSSLIDPPGCRGQSRSTGDPANAPIYAGESVGLVTSERSADVGGTAEELVEDAESIGKLQPTGESWPEKRSVAHVLTYPAQEHKLGQGQGVTDPATRERALTDQIAFLRRCHNRKRHLVQLGEALPETEEDHGHG